MTRRALGRGLEALIPTRPIQVEAPPPADGASEERSPRELEVERIRPNRYQPRQRFDAEKIRELAESMRENGVLQPLLVKRDGEAYELIAGERRLRAARLAGLRTVPVIVREADARDSLKLSILENVQREDLNPIEEAHAYQRLLDEFGMTQEEIGVRLGKSRSAIANTIRLLQLPAEVQERVQNGEITAGHARALLGAPSVEEQIEIATLVRERKMTVRDTEATTQRRKPAATARVAANPALQELEKRLEARFGTRVRIRARKSDGTAGRIEIEYYSAMDLERIFEAAGVSYLI
jgi:ParB family transcriptional regulator, chromosome partitioning protein